MCRAKTYYNKIVHFITLTGCIYLNEYLHSVIIPAKIACHRIIVLNLPQVPAVVPVVLPKTLINFGIV